MRFHEVEQRGPLGKDEGLVALGHSFVEFFEQHGELRRTVGRLPGHEGAVAAGLAQAQQDLECREYRASAF